VAGPGRPRHPGQAGPQQLARRPHRDHRGNPLLRPPARPGPRRDRGPAGVDATRIAVRGAKGPRHAGRRLHLPRSRSSTHSRTPTSRPRPHRPAAPSSPSPTRCCCAGGAPPPEGSGHDARAGGCGWLLTQEDLVPAPPAQGMSPRWARPCRRPPRADRSPAGAADRDRPSGGTRYPQFMPELDR
jgi:hypothetical protein